MTEDQEETLREIIEEIKARSYQKEQNKLKGSGKEPQGKKQETIGVPKQKSRAQGPNRRKRSTKRKAGQ